MMRLCLHGLVQYVVWEPGRSSAHLLFLSSKSRFYWIIDFQQSMCVIGNIISGPKTNCTEFVSLVLRKVYNKEKDYTPIMTSQGSSYYIYQI